MKNNNPRIVGLIISAGLSSRMGEFKPLMFHEGKSFINNILEKLNNVCDSIIVVTGHNQKAVEEEISHLEFRKNIKTVYNPDYTKGMFTSLQTGLKSANHCNWLVYHFVDQPNIPFQFYLEFVQQLNPEYEIIQPAYNNRNGHPILINSKMVKTISGYNSESNLRDLIIEEKVKKKIWDCNYPEILIDIDTPKDFSKL